MSKSKVAAHSGPCEGLLPGLQMATFSLGLHMVGTLPLLISTLIPMWEFHPRGLT